METALDHLRQVTPEILNEYLHRTGWFVEVESNCAGGIKWALGLDDIFVPLDASRSDYVYFVDEALRQLAIVEKRPEADILRDLLAGQEQEQPQPIEVKPWRVSIDLHEVKDGDGTRHFVLPDTYIAFCGENTEHMQYTCLTGFPLTSLDHTVWPENHCRACRERLREIARDMMCRLGYTPD